MMLTECGRHLRDQKQWQLKTEKVFELHLAKKSQHFEDHHYETVKIADINKDILENQHRIVLILGEPGSGKQPLHISYGKNGRTAKNLNSTHVQFLCIYAIPEFKRPKVYQSCFLMVTE